MAQIGVVSDDFPVVITEMDWAPEKYSSSWGKAVTGTAGDKGFGGNFIKIAEEAEVSWLLFTGQELLAQYDDALPDNETFLTDPEACPRPVYRKYLEYEKKEEEQSSSGSGDIEEQSIFVKEKIYILFAFVLLLY